MKNKIILSSRNPSKIEQIKGIFENTKFKILSLADAGIEGEAIEDGNTLEENAFKKAWFAYDRTKNPTIVMADDSGIFIDSLNGEPGVRSARWAGDVSTEKITEYTLDKLKDTDNRKATFRTLVAIILPNKEKETFIGEIYGHLLKEPRVPPQINMPYSSIFIPEGLDKVWAEMTVEEENRISHRGKAFRKALSFLKQ